MRRTTETGLAAFEALESRQLLALISWDGGGGDFSWHNPLNWSGDVLPGAGDDVVIAAPGTPTITHSQAVTTAVRSLTSVESIALSGGTISVEALWRQSAPLAITGGAVDGAGNLALSAETEWTGGGMAGAGKTQVLPSGVLRIAGDVTLGRDLVNNGAVRWESGDITAAGATITNLAGRTFEVGAAGGALGGTGENALINRGVLLRTGAGSVTTITIAVGSTGALDVQSGTLRLTGAAILQDVRGAGTLRIDGGATWFVGTWTGGPVVVGVGGVLRLDGRTAPDLKILERRLVNDGRVVWLDRAGSWRLASEVVNRGTLVLSGAGFIDTGAGTGPQVAPSYVTNLGVLEKRGLSDVTLRGAGGGVRLRSTGTVRVFEGRLILNGGGSSAGTFLADHGTEIVFGGLPMSLTGAGLGGAGNFRVANLSAWDRVNGGGVGSGSLVIGTAGRLLVGGGSSFLFWSLTTNRGTLTVGEGTWAYFNTLVNEATINLTSLSGGGLAPGGLTLQSTSTLRVSRPGLLGIGTSAPIELGGRLIAECSAQLGAGEWMDLMIQEGLFGATGTFAVIESPGLPAGLRLAFQWFSVRGGAVGRLLVI